MDRNAISQSCPHVTEPLGDYSSAQWGCSGGGSERPGEGVGLLVFFLGRISFQEGPARTQDFHFNAPWQAAFPRNLVKAHRKAFKNTLIANNSSASPDFPPRGTGGWLGQKRAGIEKGPGHILGTSALCVKALTKTSWSTGPTGPGLRLLPPSECPKA